MLNDREAFKAGFLKHCADEGLSLPESLALVKQASSELEKMSFLGLDGTIGKIVDIARDLTKTVGSYAVPMALLGPPAVGVGAAATYAAATDTDETDVANTRKKELAEVYREQAKKIRESRRRYASS